MGPVGRGENKKLNKILLRTTAVNLVLVQSGYIDQYGCGSTIADPTVHKVMMNKVTELVDTDLAMVI